MRKLTTKSLKLLFVGLIFITSTASQATNTAQPLYKAERDFVINIFNTFLSTPKSCSPIPYPQYESSGHFTWDAKVADVAQAEAMDLAEDDSLDWPDYSNLLLGANLGFVPVEDFEVPVVLNNQDLLDLLSVDVLANSPLCKKLMTSSYYNGKLGLGRVEKKDPGNDPKYYWVLIVANGERESTIIPDPNPSPVIVLTNPNPSSDSDSGSVYAHTVVSSQSEEIRNSFIMMQLPARDSGIEGTQQDLAITRFEKISTVKKVPDTSRFYEVAVRVVIENRGTSEAGSFRIGTWQGDDLTRAIPFTVAGQRNTWKPLVSTTLFPGESISLEGKVIFKRSRLNRKPVTLYAVADDCSDSLSRSEGPCDVKEINEDNNISDPLVIKGR